MRNCRHARNFSTVASLDVFVSQLVYHLLMLKIAKGGEATGGVAKVHCSAQLGMLLSELGLSTWCQECMEMCH